MKFIIINILICLHNFNFVMKQKLTIFGSIVATVFYATVMLTFNNNCTIAEKTLSQENTIVQYAENQISNKKDTSNAISEIVNLCKSPIKKLSNKLFASPTSLIKIKPAEFCRACSSYKGFCMGGILKYRYHFPF